MDCTIGTTLLRKQPAIVSDSSPILNPSLQIQN